MIPINLELRFGDRQVAGTAEQLDQLADIGGFMRYQVTVGERRSVICVNIEEAPPRPVTLQDAENYYEAIHYPDQASSFSDDEVFTPKEISTIASEIKAYNDTRQLKFDHMHFDF